MGGEGVPPPFAPFVLTDKGRVLEGWQNRAPPPPSSLGTVDERLLVARTSDIPAPMYAQLPVSGVQCL